MDYDVALRLEILKEKVISNISAKPPDPSAPIHFYIE